MILVDHAREVTNEAPEVLFVSMRRGTVRNSKRSDNAKLKKRWCNVRVFEVVQILVEPYLNAHALSSVLIEIRMTCQRHVQRSHRLGEFARPAELKPFFGIYDDGPSLA